MKIGIITAMPEETTAVLKAATPCRKTVVSGRLRYQCHLAGHEILLLETGMGMLNAGWGALVLAGEHPDLIISAGFGGGVRPGLAVGDVLLAQQVLHWLGDGTEEVAVGFYGLNDIALRLSLPRGTFVSCDTILSKQALAAALPEIQHPLVEMETAAVARVAATQKIPFLALRAVSDPWNEELEFSIDEFCDDQMRIRPLRVLATIMKRPRIIPQLVRLARNSRVAASGLSRAMARVVAEL